METLEITENSAILRVADAREVSGRRNVIKLVGKGVNVRNMVTTITTALAGFPGFYSCNLVPSDYCSISVLDTSYQECCFKARGLWIEPNLIGLAHDVIS